MRKTKEKLPIAKILLLVVVMMLSLLVGKGDAYATSSVSLNKTSLTMTTKDTYLLKVKGNSSRVKWSSNNKKVVTVSSTGKVTAKKKGKAVVTAKVKGKSYKCKVTVENIATISKKKLTLGINEKRKLKLNYTVNKPKWKSSNSSVAKVTSKGVVTGKKKGNAKITAILHGKTYTCNVKVTNNRYVKVPTVEFRWDGKDYDGSLLNVEFVVEGRLDDGSCVNYYYNSGSGKFYTDTGELAMIVSKKIYSDYAVVVMEFYRTDGSYDFKMTTPVLTNEMHGTNIVAKIYLPNSNRVGKYTTDTGMYRSYTGCWYWSPFVIDHGKVIAN